MADTVWPKQGSCGACGRGAFQVPSLRWWHHGRPCRATYQTLWHADDFPIKLTVVFVPAGEPLPTAPGWHSHVTARNEDGIPVEFGMCQVDHSLAVREFLAREAEEGVRG